jgi:hypothetical protein
MSVQEYEYHYPEEWTDIHGNRRLTCCCGSELPCSKQGRCNHINPNNRIMKCNREHGHPGQHCRNQFQSGGTAYENIWWSNKRMEVSDEV